MASLAQVPEESLSLAERVLQLIREGPGRCVREGKMLRRLLVTSSQLWPVLQELEKQGQIMRAPGLPESVDPAWRLVYPGKAMGTDDTDDTDD